MKIQEPKDHNNASDPFSEYLRGRLENHTTPVRPGGFDRIEKELSRTKPRRAWLTAGLLLAATLAGLLWLLPFSDNSSVSSAFEEVAAVVEENESSLGQQALSAEEGEPLPIQANPSAPVLIARQEIVYSDNTDMPIPDADEVIEELAAGRTDEVATPDAPKAAEQRREEASPPKKEPSRQQKSPIYQGKSRTKKRRNESSWMVSAGFNVGGNLPSDFSTGLDFNKGSMSGMNEEMSIPDWSGMDFSGDYKDSNLGQGEIPDPQSYVNENHRLPLSFGVTVRKRLSERFAVESGLIYTYLHSSFSGYVAAKNRATLSQHYLGVPLNAVVYLYDSSSWNVYLSGGGMIEKGVQSVYSTMVYVNSEEKRNTVKEANDGFQYSVNAALGISYKIQQHWSLYAEPRFSYYFDNDQPVSFRTENSLSVGLGAGLRFEF